MICTSCNNVHDENYCPNCGEKKGIKKITLASTMEDAFSSISNMDKGLLFNLKTLTLRPQKITVDYIRGKRKGILNPISFLIFSVTLYIIVIEVFQIPREPRQIDAVSKPFFAEIGYEAGKFIRTYLKFFWVLVIIPFALSLKLAFGKYNFIEHLAISAFIIGQATLIGTISYLALKIPLIIDPIVYLAMLWLVYRVFTSKNDRIPTALSAILALILFGVQLFVIMLLIGIGNAY